jgi:hypothetical protein
MANQPTMSPDALTGPGRALQGLGRAISGLSGAFEAMNEPSDTDKLTAQLALLDASNNAEKYYTERLSSFTPETDPDAWHQDTRAGIDSIFTDAERRVPGYPKLVDQYRVRSHAFVGDYDVKAHKYATGVKTERYATSAFNSLRSSLESADPTTPEGIALIDTIDKQLVRIPGLDVEKARSQIADDMVKRFEAEAAADPIAAMEKVEAIKKWREQLQIAPPQPQQGQGVGPQSSTKPIMDDSQRAKLTGVDDRVVEKLGLLQGEMGRRFKINSGYRSKAHNQRVGGASKSQHIHGNAIDLDVSSLSNEERTAMIAKASALGFTGIGVYNNAIHLDIGGRRAWGSDYTHKTVPSWARSAIETHMRGGFAGTQVAESGMGGGIANDAPDYRGKRGPASIRFNNPGAMYPGPSSRKFGAVETKIIGGGHKIAVFPDAVSGAAAQFDLLSRNYTGKTLGSAIAKWSGGNSVGTYLKVIERETGITANTVLTKEMVADPRIAVPIAKAMAVQEAGRDYPMSDAQWMQAHQMFSGGTQVASSAPNAAPAPGRPEPTQVADASGRIGAPSGGQIAERVASRVDDNNRPTNTIPGQQTAQAKGLSPQEFEQQQKDAQARATPGEVRQERPQWASPSIRTHMLDKFNERAPMLAKAAQTQLRAYVERVEKSAGDGYLLPEQERALIHERMNRYGSEELKVRLKAAEQAAAATAQMKQLPPTVLSGQIAQLRSAMNQAGATPEIIAKAKAAEALHTKMVKELNENAIGWGAEAGVIGPQMPITPQTFSVDALRQRAEAANVVAQHYGLEYRQFFTKEEKEALEAQFSTGGDNMLAMMGMMYEAFGDDLPRAVAEISPKYPEAARAGYLLSTGGDPKAAEAIAQSIERRQDPNYKGNIKLEADADKIAKDVFGDYFRDMPQRERDATMRAAEAIYIANFRPDMGMKSDATFKAALKSAMGERTNAAGEVYGGVVNTKGGGAFFPSNKEAILLPSNVRQKTWRQLFDFISVNDMVESGHPIPVDANGTPLRMPKVLGGRMVQVGDGKYMFELTNRDGSPAWVMEGQPPGAAKSDAAAPLRPSKPFVLDLKTLTPVLRRRWPDFFWKE